MKRRDFLVASTGFAGLIIPPLARAQVRPCPPPVLGVEGGQSVNTACSAGNAEADWLARISGAGVVWFHDFRSAAEVNAFRWTSAYGSGNDPNGSGTTSPLVQRDTTDGVTGGGCLKLTYVNGTSSHDSVWWRPFSPLTAPGNGKAANDPGANGTITPRSYSATDGGNQISNFGAFGYYAHPSAAMKGGVRDGTEFYLQFRVKGDPRRTISGMTQVGKLLYLSVTDFSLSAQEIVTYSGAFPVAGNGAPNYHRMYAVSFNPIEQSDSLGRPGQQVGHDGFNYTSTYCDVNNASLRGNCWSFSGGWDTLMYHLVPGQGGVENQRIEVFAAHAGETSFTKIWDMLYATFHSDDPPEGYNAAIFSIYQNGATEPSEFWHKYDQIIFSKNFIPCPQV